MAAANGAFSPTSTSACFLLFFLFLLVLPVFRPPSYLAAADGSYGRILLAASRRTSRSQIPNCSDLISPQQCNENPNCRWCRSETIDDMCFSKVEAWRLPAEVFTCIQNLSSSSKSATL